MNRELKFTVEKDLESLKRVVLDHVNLNEGNSPKYIIRDEFYKKYFEIQETTIRNYTNTSPLFKYVNYHEFRITKLNSHLNQSRIKINNPLPQVNTETSQLIKINNIIKGSFELTTYICLINWLESIYQKEDPRRVKLSEKVYLEKTAKRLHETNNKSFTPDMLFHVNNIVETREFENNRTILEQVLMHIRSGHLESAQKVAEYYNQYNISTMLNGGLPFNDFMLDPEEKFENVDFDLFPPYMNNREMEELKAYLNRGHFSPNSTSRFNSNNTPYGQVVQFNDKIVGNANWLLWVFANHHSSSDDSQDKLVQTVMIQSYLSGNVITTEKREQSIYNRLYSQILSLFNLSLIEQYQSTELVEYSTLR